MIVTITDDEIGKVELLETYGSEELIAKAARQSYGSDEVKNQDKLIKFLMENDHGVPFEYAGIVVRVTAPIFVLRHFYTYRTFTRSERSLRYTENNPQYYRPEVPYLKDYNKHSGDLMLQVFYDQVQIAYQQLREYGYRKEDARVVVPMGMYSSAIFRMDLRNLGHFLQQRLASDTQAITRQYAGALYKIASSSGFHTWALYFFTKNSELIEAYDNDFKE